MFHFHQNNEFNLQFPNENQNIQHDHDPILSRYVFESNDLCVNNIVGKRLKYSSAIEEQLDKSTNNKDKKKMEHKEIERRRRQVMADLFVSLRSLLPLEYIKGKRSKSDHMDEAVAYIKHLQKNINTLETKRDKLKLSRDSNSLVAGRSYDSITVAVIPQFGGIEILINNRCSKEEVPISRVLQVLHNEGLSVVSFVSTTINERIVHSLTSKVISDVVCVDPSLLQQKLYGVLNS